MSDYGWVIDRDHLYDPNDSIALDEAHTVGPHDVPPDLEGRLEDGEGRTFQMFDDDGGLYYTGRFLSDDPESLDTDAPLYDFGQPNAGCTTIEYPASESLHRDRTIQIHMSAAMAAEYRHGRDLEHPDSTDHTPIRRFPVTGGFVQLTPAEALWLSTDAKDKAALLIEGGTGFHGRVRNYLALSRDVDQALDDDRGPLHDFGNLTAAALRATGISAPAPGLTR